MAVAFAVSGFLLAVPVTRRVLDYLARRVLVVEGVVEGRKGYRSGGAEVGYHGYYYRVGGHRFAVPRAAYEALAHGRPYRVFYAPYSKTLVAIEPLTGSTSRG